MDMNEFVHVCDLTMKGRSLSPTEVQRLESTVEANPKDIDARVKLLGFYFGQGTHNRVPCEHACKHVFWFIQNAPEHEVLEQPEGVPHFHSELDDLFQRGKELWNEQIKENQRDASVLKNASYYFYHRDWVRAISLLEAALELEPQNARLKDRLAFTCELGARSDKTADRLHRAMVLREELLNTASARDRLRALTNLAETAYRRDDFKTCREAAEQVLQSSDRNGDEFHQAHQLIGLVQLADSDRAGARLSLLQSGKVKSTPVLSSFGPKFQLAKQLLHMGERAAVLKYLEDCSLFWESGQKDLAYWWIQMQLGGTPALDKQGSVELFLPRWLNVPAKGFLSVIRLRRK
jgi:tetratricopeptide (TPR) repeat protein